MHTYTQACIHAHAYTYTYTYTCIRLQPCTIVDEVLIETEAEVFRIPITATVVTHEDFEAWQVALDVDFLCTCTHALALVQCETSRRRSCWLVYAWECKCECVVCVYLYV